jgi:ectoine hydroxylase-related dioxygenase (phytanoyl-CoA dioxygenase family)
LEYEDFEAASQISKGDATYMISIKNERIVLEVLIEAFTEELTRFSSATKREEESNYNIRSIETMNRAEKNILELALEKTRFKLDHLDKTINAVNFKNM